MDWERAKNYLLIFFILLNTALGLLLLQENRQYTMTGDQERHIRTVLNRYNISLYTLPLRRFPPMRPINITGFYYNHEEIVAMFFVYPQAVEYSYRFGSHFYAYGSSTLIISGGFIFYENPYGFGDGEGEINAFIAAHFPDFVPDSNFSIDGGYGRRLIYRQEYRGQLVHSNFIEFIVTDSGITQIEMQFGEILGFAGTPSAIFSPDEALLTFVQRVRHITLETPKTIRRIDLVYFQEYFSDQPSLYHAVPFYRIFTICSGDRPYLINAFTNTIID